MTGMNLTEPAFDAMAQFLQSHDNFVVFTHVKPDGDALGSALGLVRFLQDNGKTATAVLPEDMPDKYVELIGGDFVRDGEALVRNPDSTLLLLDTARRDRAATGATTLDFDRVVNIDHHIDNNVDVANALIVGNAAATAEIIAALTQKCPNWQLLPAAATRLYLGLCTDTGAFRFSNTTAATFRCAAYLVEHGAQIEQVINAAFFAKTASQQLFEADLVLNHVATAHQNRFRYGVVTEELLARYHFDMKDGESVIELLREIDSAIIVVLLYPKDGDWKLSFRSKDRRYPVGPLARELGGGGHEMAAGATIKGQELNAVIDLLIAKTGELFES